jgi:hypothetical protein
MVAVVVVVVLILEQFIQVALLVELQAQVAVMAAMVLYLLQAQITGQMQLSI